ncbi:hypothetical protein BASA81_002811 [Batrachochytrium salamandrivorans]|nr:hypothetical protein BASA81_002811 [Batrachochytrium salamandrivorans]
MLLPRAGQCKFCATRLGAGSVVVGAERLGEEHGMMQFPCPYCNAKMLLVLHPHAVVEFKGALEELVAEEPAIHPSPPPPPPPPPNVWGEDNRLRKALKRSRQTRQASKQPPAPPPSATSRSLQVVYKKA